MSKNNGTYTDPKAISNVIDDNNNNIINNTTSINTNLAQVQHEEHEQKETEYVEKSNGAYRGINDNDLHEMTSSKSGKSINNFEGFNFLQSLSSNQKRIHCLLTNLKKK